ncbi:MAG: hypothetical protein DMF80_22380 [Acidobacteria bacterium]|nr:MAG: hypothetical protein DMF80_22380 [Acidobacteriota bacterium]
MRILQLGAYPPPHGGVQANLAAIRQFLLDRGVPCAVVNLTRHRRAAGADVCYPRNALQVLGLLLRLPADVVHLHIGGDLSLRLVALALVCSLLPRRRAVLTFHSGGYPSSPAGRRARPWTVRGLVLRRLDRLVAVNREIADLFVRFGVQPDRIRLIPPFAMGRPSPEASLPEPMRGFFRAHSPLLATVGLLEPEYDLPLQVELLGVLRHRHPEAGLVIIGSGSLEAELRRKIESAPYAEHVLLCGDVPHAATLRAIAESDLLLRTTLYDGDSVAVREALHLGTPVIATDNGMRPAGVELVPPSDLAALQRAVEGRLARAGTRAPLCGNGQENLEAVFQLYETLAGERDRRRPAGQFIPAGLPREPGHP